MGTMIGLIKYSYSYSEFSIQAATAYWVGVTVFGTLLM
jgi:hypothetical protein